MLCVLLSGCFHGIHSRKAGGLIFGGAAGMAVGAVVAVGCLSEIDEGCAGGSTPAEVGIGIPILIAGAAAVITGFVLNHEPRQGPPSGLPPPVMPDPFVEPLSDPPIPD